MVTTVLEQTRLRNTAGTLKAKPIDMAGLVNTLTGEYAHRRPVGVAIGSLEPVIAQVDLDKMRGSLA